MTSVLHRRGPGGEEVVVGGCSRRSRREQGRVSERCSDTYPE